MTTHEADPAPTSVAQTFTWYTLGVLPCLLKGIDIGTVDPAPNFIVTLTQSGTLEAQLTTEQTAGGDPPLVQAAATFSNTHAPRAAFKVIDWPDGFPIRIRSITGNQRFILDPNRLLVPWPFPVVDAGKKAAFESAASAAITTNWPPPALSGSDHSSHAIFLDPVMHAADTLTKRGDIRFGQPSAEVKAALAAEAATLPSEQAAYTHMAPGIPIGNTAAWAAHSFTVVTLDQERHTTHVKVETRAGNAFASIVLYLGVRPNTNAMEEEATLLGPLFANWPCGAFE